MTTPARRQYLRIKKQHQDEVLLFRMGDFYETFDDDARTISRELEIALTSREMGKGQRIPLAGIPYHALESYLARLIRKGYKVAICEQTSDPATSRGLVDREVVRVVTPGTLVEDSLLENKANNYLAAAIVDGGDAGLAYVDITTSEFATSQMPLADLAVELARLMPSEVLVPEGDGVPPVEVETTVTLLGPEPFELDWAAESLMDHFGVGSLEAYGCERLPLAVRAAGAIVDYLGRNQKASLTQIVSLHTYSTSTFMVLDAQTRRNLELFSGGRWGDPKASLLSVLDRTRTSMGGRLLRQWVGQPLLDVGDLVRRQEAVAWFHRSALRRGRITALLAEISDLERLTNRVRGNTSTPRDLVALGKSLRTAPTIRGVLEEDEDASLVQRLARDIEPNHDIVALIEQSIVDDPPTSLADGGVIREGFSPELDALRASARDSQDYIAGLELRERERTGIKSLKVGYNRVFGYYIEVSKSNLARVPDDYSRRQTLVGGERYITPEMKEYESRILSAQERMNDMESTLHRQVCGQIAEAGPSIMTTGAAIARVDALCSLGEVAAGHGYVRPELSDRDTLNVRQGRHPVVERSLPTGAFVANDTRMASSEEQLIVLTGPNMSGKSTYIRQVALIVLMAQIGSFVPAESANIGVVDRIFTRVGLQDDLALGQSTFMVEMLETAAIINHATPRSLVVLDEIGRGTSTYDGLAIARAVAEYIHNHPRLGCNTLFATHYHELTKLADSLPRARNYNVAVSEEKGDVVFLRRIVPGGADRSYGVHVARLAGIPRAVINRAWEILGELEAEAGEDNAARQRSGRRRRTPPPSQLPLIGAPSPAVEGLLALDIASLTPLEALNKLYELQETAKSSGLETGPSWGTGPPRRA